VYTANFEVMEEVSRMSDTTTVYGKTLENAGYVTRKMILAKIEGKIEGKTEGEEQKALEIARNALAQGLSIETVAAITTLDIERVRGILTQK
jgi:predicted transposase/invertase (TIGR01784 family)